VVGDLFHDEAMDGHDRVIARYLKPDLLISDDFGKKQLPKRSGEFLFEIVMRRYETRSTMTTTNRPIEDWGKLLGDRLGIGTGNVQIGDSDNSIGHGWFLTRNR